MATTSSSQKLSPFFARQTSFGDSSTSKSSKEEPFLENPFLKNQQYSLGSRAAATAMDGQSQRSPLGPLTTTTVNLQQQGTLSSSLKPSLKKPVEAMPGPPPKMSLSLMQGISLMEVSRSVCF
jgi:hypothetical protein